MEHPFTMELQPSLIHAQEVTDGAPILLLVKVSPVLGEIPAKALNPRVAKLC